MANKFFEFRYGRERIISSQQMMMTMMMIIKYNTVKEAAEG
jgi:hypothetical protein